MLNKKDFRIYLYSGLAFLFIVIFIIVAVINGITAKRSDEILIENIEGRLVATANAATGYVDGGSIETYWNQKEAAGTLSDYDETLKSLRRVQFDAQVEYIYVIYKSDDGWHFIFDTDPETICGDFYTLTPENALIFNDVANGKSVAITRIVDSWGAHRTYAVPIFQGGSIVAVLGVDILDTVISEQVNVRRVNNIILYSSLGALFIIIFFAVKWMADKNVTIRRQLEVQEERYTTAVASASDAIFDYNVPAGKVYIGHQFFNMLGIPSPDENGSEMPIEKFYELIGAENENRLLQEAARLALKETNSFDIELEIPGEKGSSWITLRGKGHYDNIGEFNRASGSISEITVRKRLEAEIHSMAYYDKLTKIPNRAFLFQTLNGLIKRKDEKFALYFIDLDNFKQVNDNFGHDAGDNMLRHFAGFIKKTMENSGMGYQPENGAMDIVSRFGGDEFVLINTKAKIAADATAFAQKMLDSFNTSSGSALARQYNVSMTIGVAVYPKHADDAENLIKCADIAMYHAKKLGKNSVKAYDESLKETDDVALKNPNIRKTPKA